MTTDLERCYDWEFIRKRLQRASLVRSCLNEFGDAVMVTLVIPVMLVVILLLMQRLLTKNAVMMGS